MLDKYSLKPFLTFDLCEVCENTTWKFKISSMTEKSLLLVLKISTNTLLKLFTLFTLFFSFFDLGTPFAPRLRHGVCSNPKCSWCQTAGLDGGEMKKRKCPVLVKFTF